MTLRNCILILSAALCCSSASAEGFLSSETSDRLITFGARIGLNTSNVTMSDKVFPDYNINSWGNGFDAGIVADICFRDFISLQPGFFFQSRTGRYFYGDREESSFWGDDLYIQTGHLRSYRFYIPVVASLHFNITGALRWDVDFGPYLAANLYSNEGNKIIYDYFEPTGLHVSEPMRLAAMEFGLKFGTGLRILDHYVVGVHYLAGLTDPWKADFAGGHAKCWTFTVGYDF
ncbi:MAG: PorT family protein [Bacteroidales bacterium]|nr:PorT family protein [Bacteroidales bacterium]